MPKDRNLEGGVKKGRFISVSSQQTVTLPPSMGWNTEHPTWEWFSKNYDSVEAAKLLTETPAPTCNADPLSIDAGEYDDTHLTVRDSFLCLRVWDWLKINLYTPKELAPEEREEERRMIDRLTPSLEKRPAREFISVLLIPPFFKNAATLLGW